MGTGSEFVSAVPREQQEVRTVRLLPRLLHACGVRLTPAEASLLLRSGWHVRATPSAAWWTTERIIEAIRRWVAEHGDTPRQMEWRWASPYWPQATTVHERFGSWNGAMMAAGFTGRQGRPKQDGAKA